MATHSTTLHILVQLLRCLVALALALNSRGVTLECKRPPVIFNFGDSNSDTGGLVGGLGYQVNLPNGRTFFRKSTGRLSDGRLLIDFLCASLNSSFLTPYLDSMSRSKFSNGANFAVVGSRMLPKYLPFALNIQVMQFLHFKARSLELTASGLRNFVDDAGFKNALYVIDIGQNDIADAFSKLNMSYAQVIRRIPLVIQEINSAVTTLYNQGGRKFWIHNTGPLGCLPQQLQLNPNEDLDTNGCISSYNDAAKAFNEQLNQLCLKLRSQLTGATIVHVDIYSIKYNLIANAAKYGFARPLMACCGNGGPPYNYNIRATCGNPGSTACGEGSKYINWDGVHYTEEANTIVVSQVLSTTYSSPPTTFDFFCRN